MSNRQNDQIKEAAYEDFSDLYFTSDSFASLVNDLIPEFCDEQTKCGTAIKIVFEQLWKNDNELLIKNKRIAVEALLMYKKAMKSLNEL